MTITQKDMANEVRYRIAYAFLYNLFIQGKMAKAQFDKADNRLKNLLKPMSAFFI